MLNRRGMILSMRLLAPILLFFAVITIVSAHVPYIVTQESLRDIKAIEEPEISRAFYGAMTGFPHTYEIRATEPFHLYAQILVPDIESSVNNVSGIIIKETTPGGRVMEVTRFLAKDAVWESQYEPWGGDSYRVGGTFEKDVDAGVYRIEVSTPDNIEKYVLVVGKTEDFGEIGYFETIGRIAEVKAFFGKPKILVIQSPFVYVPLLIALTLGGVLWWRRRSRRYTTDTL